MAKGGSAMERLKGLEALRVEVRVLEQAIQTLTPEERLILQMTVLAPEKGAVDRLSTMLEVETSSIYRRRRRAIRKVERALKGT